VLLVARWPGCYIPATPPKRMMVYLMRKIYLNISDKNNTKLLGTKKKTIRNVLSKDVRNPIFTLLP